MFKFKCNSRQKWCTALSQRQSTALVASLAITIISIAFSGMIFTICFSLLLFAVQCRRDRRTADRSGGVGRGQPSSESRATAFESNIFFMCDNKNSFAIIWEPISSSKSWCQSSHASIACNHFKASQSLSFARFIANSFLRRINYSNIKTDCFLDFRFIKHFRRTANCYTTRRKSASIER